MRHRFAILMSMVLVAPSGSAQPRLAFKVIVNPSNAVSVVDRQFANDAFLKRTTRWPTGEPIRAADLKNDSPTRQAFSLHVLGRSVSAVTSYWQQVIFSGRDVPPPELSDDAEVVKYVIKHPGGVGYVSIGADAGSAKVVELN